LISVLEYRYFIPMIPHTIKSIWESTLDRPDISLKLCGAGGGGFFLGFAQKHVDITTLPADVIVL
jgi:mevalonate kinase